MLIYLVYSVSKSGTTSIFKALTDNRKFPVIQTHDDFMNISVHDGGTGFADRVRREFAEFVRPNDQFDGEIDWSTEFDSVSIYLGGDRAARDRFLAILQSSALRIATPMRDPVSRANSAMLHWLDTTAIDALYRTALGKPFDARDIRKEDLDGIKHRAVKAILEAYADGALDEEKTNKMFTDMFDGGVINLDYISVFYVLSSYFWFTLCPLRSDSHRIHEKNGRNWRLFYFRLDRLSDVLSSLYEFFDLPKDYAYPRSRDARFRKLLFTPPDSKCRFLKPMNEIEWT